MTGLGREMFLDLGMLSRASPGRGLATQGWSMALYAGNIHLTLDICTGLSKSPAHAGGPAMRGALRAWFRAVS